MSTNPRDDLALDVDAFFETHLVREPDVIAAARRRGRENGLPAIDVSPAVGKFLHLLAGLAGPRILEIGCLGGVSALWFATGLKADGHVTSLEISDRNAALARESIAAAGLSDRVTILIGDAAETLKTQLAPASEHVFDLAFIDADKESTAVYFTLCLERLRPGGLLVIDNVVRGGKILTEPNDPPIAGILEMVRRAGDEPGVTGTALQIDGVKGYDGLAIFRKTA